MKQAIARVLMIAGWTLCTLPALAADAPPAPAATQAPAADKKSSSSIIDVPRVEKKINDCISLVDAGGVETLPEIRAKIDEAIYYLRGPNPDGTAFFFAEVKQNPNAEPLEIGTARIVSVHDRKLDPFSAEVTNAYELDIHSPQQRGFFKNNGDAFVGHVKVNYVINGKAGVVERDINQWLHRTETYTIPLPGIAERARIEITAGVHIGDVDKSLLKLRARQPEITDDPKNPFTYSVNMLKDARIYAGFQDKREMIRKRLTSALEALELAPPVPGNVPTSSAQIAQKLEHILYLLGGNEVEQDQARSLLKELIGTLRQ